MITCTRRFQFAYGHRVLMHESKCRHMHGHNGVALVTAIAPELDSLGRVVDFGVLKQRIGSWIDENWDHGFLCHEDDGDVMEAVRAFESGQEFRQKLYVMPCNPTAENMAEHLLTKICPTLLDGTGVSISEVTIWETENCFATARIVE